MTRNIYSDLSKKKKKKVSHVLKQVITPLSVREILMKIHIRILGVGIHCNDFSTSFTKGNDFGVFGQDIPSKLGSSLKS